MRLKEKNEPPYVHFGCGLDASFLMFFTTSMEEMQ